jgi:hypothetical protein
MALINNLITYRDTLSSEARERLNVNTLALQKQLLADTQREKALRIALPRILFTPIQSGFDRKAKSHDKTIKRSMLGVEIAEKEADKAEQEACKDNEVEIILGTPLGRKRTHTLVNRTPGKPLTPVRLPPGRQQSLESPPNVPPALTAPARLTRVGRPRVKTAKL